MQAHVCVFGRAPSSHHAQASAAPAHPGMRGVISWMHLSMYGPPLSCPHAQAPQAIISGPQPILIWNKYVCVSVTMYGPLLSCPYAQAPQAQPPSAAFLCTSMTGKQVSGVLPRGESSPVTA